jgi:hypothetical protein
MTKPNGVKQCGLMNMKPNARPPKHKSGMGVVCLIQGSFPSRCVCTNNISPFPFPQSLTLTKHSTQQFRSYFCLLSVVVWHSDGQFVPTFRVWRIVQPSHTADGVSTPKLITHSVFFCKNLLNKTRNLKKKKKYFLSASKTIKKSLNNKK